ncbi:GPI-anchored protein llg1 [Orobanche gracilis]
MGFSEMKCCLILVFCLSIFTSLSASTSISDDIIMLQALTERRLLQAKKPCPVDFEYQNYSIITSKCRGPEYQVIPCCSAFKEFACPFVDDLDDLTNDCASRMFSYINLNGQYPPGLFASLCREGMEGLACPEPPPP